MLFLFIGCAKKQISVGGRKHSSYSIGNKTYHPRQVRAGFEERGLATWRGSKLHNRKTANGEQYNPLAMTAAHKTLPFNTLIQVKNIYNGRTVIVRINDRGPFTRGDGRILDLSEGAAKQLDMLHQGVVKISLRVLQVGDSLKDIN